MYASAGRPACARQRCCAFFDHFFRSFHSFNLCNQLLFSLNDIDDFEAACQRCQSIRDLHTKFKRSVGTAAKHGREGEGERANRCASHSANCLGHIGKSSMDTLFIV
jgi:hypothetical protein